MIFFQNVCKWKFVHFWMFSIFQCDFFYNFYNFEFLLVKIQKINFFFRRVHARPSVTFIFRATTGACEPTIPPALSPIDRWSIPVSHQLHRFLNFLFDLFFFGRASSNFPNFWRQFRPKNCKPIQIAIWISNFPRFAILHFSGESPVLGEMWKDRFCRKFSTLQKRSLHTIF